MRPFNHIAEKTPEKSSISTITSRAETKFAVLRVTITPVQGSLISQRRENVTELLVPAVLFHTRDRCMNRVHGIVWCHVATFTVDSVAQEVEAGAVRAPSAARSLVTAQMQRQVSCEV